MEEAGSFMPNSSASEPIVDEDGFVFPEFGILEQSVNAPTPFRPPSPLNADEILRERQRYKEMESKWRLTDSESSDSDGEDSDKDVEKSENNKYIPPKILKMNDDFKSYIFNPEKVNTRIIFGSNRRKIVAAAMAIMPENPAAYAFHQAVFFYIDSGQTLAFHDYEPSLTQILAIFYALGADFSSESSHFYFLSEKNKNEAVNFANLYLITPASGENENLIDIQYVCVILHRLFLLLTVIRLPLAAEIPIFARVLMEIALDKQVINHSGLRKLIKVSLEKFAQLIPLPQKLYQHWLVNDFFTQSLIFPCAWKLDLMLEALHPLYSSEDFTNFSDFLNVLDCLSTKHSKADVDTLRFQATIHFLRFGILYAELTEAQFKQLGNIVSKFQIPNNLNIAWQDLKIVIERINKHIIDNLPSLQSCYMQQQWETFSNEKEGSMHGNYTGTGISNRHGRNPKTILEAAPHLEVSEVKILQLKLKVYLKIVIF